MSAAAAKPIELAPLRRLLRRKRAALATATQHAHALSVTRRIVASGLLLTGRTFAVYDAVDGELDTARLIDRLLAAGREVALPVIQERGIMDFYRITTTTPLRRNAHGILEPDTVRARYQPPLAIDVVFAPLVGFDGSGHRLGMGGGYYDRYLGRPPHRPLVVGLAHALQRVDELPRASWDVPLDVAVTEDALTTFSDRARRFGKNS